MTDRQKQAIEALNKVRACSNALTKEEYFILLEFVIQPNWSPTWTPPQPLEPFYKVTCEQNAEEQQ